MPQAIRPGQGILYMKVGTHANETLDRIIARKTKEIEEAGFAYWGYGGNTCHPQTMVQPFARSYVRAGGVIYLCMQPIDSRHFAETIRADEFSTDCIRWQSIHPSIHVHGSRYALVIKNLHQEEFDLRLSDTKVVLGNCMGTRGNEYIRGRVDKACLEITTPFGASDETSVHIGLIAELIEPFAVYVRNRS